MEPIPNSYWVQHGRFLAGEYPGEWSEAGSRHRLRQFLEAGLSFFVDLTEAGEYGLQAYAPYLPEEAKKLGQSVGHQRLSIPDRGTPTPKQMTHILDTIDSALAAGQRVYVHCYAGIGRTGTVVGCYLVRHGMAGKEALNEIARLRQGIPDAWMTSPETKAQREMVRRWRVGE
jgi:protein-tyrosine phosphatase